MRLERSGSVWYDWWHYGGLVRDVALVAQERVAVRRQEIRTTLADAAATVNTRVFLERFQPGDRLTVDAQAFDPLGRAVARAGQAIEGSAGPASVALALTVPEPTRWHFDQPSLYRMVVEVRDAKGSVLDRREEASASEGPRRDPRDHPVRLKRHEGPPGRAHPARPLPAAPRRAGLRRSQGLVDENRQRMPSYTVWKDETSPARLSVEWTKGSPFGPPTGFRATVARRPPTELPSYDLRGYRLEWDARDHEGALRSSGSQALPLVGPPAVVDGSWPATTSREVRLSVRLLRPTGFVAAEKSERWWEPRSGGLSPEQAKKQGLATP